MKIILTDLAPKLLDAWTEFFGNEENVSVVESDITKIKCDAIVSPANSFGFMDGGLDYALSERFGWDLEKGCKKLLKNYLKVNF
jgi:O-acetyl-ADP-ribose deacetylase (regulator of RNase III)